MFKYRSNANRSLFSNKIFYVRHSIPSFIFVLLLIFVRSTHARIVATRGSRELQTTSQLSSNLVENQRDDLRHALYVISLDGKITALNADDHGQQIWIADTGTPLVDSSLSKIEIARESGSVHLIPSLIGGLYEKYDNDGHIEASPFDADSLLDASFKLHEDLVITGGKHVDTLGLDSQTGQVIYSFSKDNVKEQKTTDHNNSRSTLVVKRTIQTVRARSIRSGYEKWNFSVSNHELIYLHSQPNHVVLEHTSTGADYYQYQLQAGIVVAFDKDRKILWTSSINAPIAAVWEYKNGRLTERSLFDHGNMVDDSFHSDPSVSQPMAFIGEFNSTPYVLVSESIQKQLILSARKIASSPRHRRSNLLAWDKAYQKRTIYIEGDIGPSENPYVRALGVKKTENRYPVALRPSSTQRQPSTDSNDERTCETFGYFALTNLLITDESDERRMETRLSEQSYLLTVSTIVIGALVTLISYLVYKRTHTKTLRQQSSMTDIGTDYSNQQTTASSSTMILESQSSEILVTPPFQSRYNLEYEHVRFLGRGGFGVVFEAINKLDERRVAIKRVSLKRASGKERALKEIRYLAALNHRHLIQYYYAWNESPPVGWQEDEDKRLLIRTNHMTSRDSISSFPTSANDSESIHQRNTSKLPSKPTFELTNRIIEFTFDRSPNPLRIDEDFSNTSDKENQLIQQDDSSDSGSSSRRNRRLTTTKSSMSSSSPFYDHSSFSDDDDSDVQTSAVVQVKEKTETDDDGIVFLHDEKNSSSNRIVKDQKNSSIERHEKDIPTTYFYFVMELCQPESLRDRLIQHTIDRQQAWLIFDQIVQGIEYIHSKKLIHRDLKPSNILFSMDNTVKIGDFGLVSAFGEDKSTKKRKNDDDKFDRLSVFETASVTSDAGENNEIGGTILYMSPEQINRQSYNQKVDIYAMGIILFELLYPFSTQMGRIQALTKVRQNPPVFPADFECVGNNRKQLICRLIRWLLSHSAHDRPKASELRQATLYHTILELESPNLYSPDSRQSISTMSNGQDVNQTCSSSLANQQQRARISSSPFRRTVSSSILQSHRSSESFDADPLA